MKRFLAMLVAAMLIITAFAGCASSGTEAEANGESPVAVKIGNTEYTVEEMNYMYIATFNEIYYNIYYTYYSYGIDVSTIIDVTKPLEEQMFSEEMTWHDYVLDYTAETVKSITGIYEEALANNFVLPEDVQADIDTFDEQLEEIAAENSMTVEEYLAASYGEGISRETVKKMTEIQLYCNAYLQYYNDNVVVTDEDIEAYYEANKKDIDTVAMRYFFTPVYSDEEGSEYTSEDAKEQAEALAAVQTAEEFDALAYEFADEEQKQSYDDGASTVINGISYSGIGIEEVSEWLFDEARQPGETYFYNDETSKSYLVVMYEGFIDPNYNLIDIRHILIAPEENEEGKKTDEAWAEAEAKANEIYEGYLAGEMTEEAFSELAKEHSADGNAAEGGIYEGVAKGQMVETFNDWCFDEARQPGDSGIVKTEYGYHIMYFVGFGENNLYSTIQPTIVSEKVSAWITECGLNVAEERTEEFENIGGMIDDIVNASSESSEGEAEAEKEALSASTVIICVLVAVIIICIIIIIRNGSKKKAEPEEIAEEAEESVLEATDEDLTEEELIAEEAFEENVSEEETEEEAAEEETSEE